MAFYVKEAFEKEAERLLKGEISAIEAYDKVIDKYYSNTVGLRLKEIVSDHREAEALLREKLLKRGVPLPESSGTWGVWANLVTRISKSLSEKLAIKVLKEGEEHGVKDYQGALEQESFDPDIKMLIENSLLPRQKEHIKTLDELL
jgi:hypothetical protein